MRVISRLWLLAFVVGLAASSPGAAPEEEEGKYEAKRLAPTAASPVAPLAPPEAAWDFQTLLPSRRSKFFRASIFEVSFLDQSNRLFSGSDMADPPMPTFVDNPQDDQLKFEWTFKPGMAILSIEELSAAYSLATGKQTRGLVTGHFDDPLHGLPDREKLFRLLHTRGYGNGKRWLKALTLKAGVSERAELVGTLAVPEEFVGQDETEGIFSVTFDADSIAIFPGEVAAAYAALEQHIAMPVPGGSRLNRVSLEHADRATCLGRRPVECLQQISRVPIRGRWLAALIPSITVKTVDQFDLVAHSGTIFRSPGEDSLETVTLSWDLGKTLDGAAHRRAALQAIARHLELVERDARFGQKLAIESTSLRVPRAFPVAVQLRAAYVGADSPPQGVKWTLATPAAGFKLLPTGQLEAWDAASGDHRLGVEARDDVGNETRSTIHVEVF